MEQRTFPTSRNTQKLGESRQGDIRVRCEREPQVDLVYLPSGSTADDEFLARLHGQVNICEGWLACASQCHFVSLVQASTRWRLVNLPV